MKITRNFLFIALGVLLFFLMLLFNPFRVNPEAAKVLAVAALMITWWVTESLPMPVVALLPILLFPLFGIATIRSTASNYGDPIIFLFMGGFLIGLAIEKWNLHKRIALSIVNRTGTSGNRIVLGFIIATGFLSMWLSNTATTMMMFPIAASVILVMNQHSPPSGNVRNFAMTLMLAIAYASNFGGLATIIGTPPNVAFAGFIQDKYQYNFGFFEWMMICLPVAIILLAALYFVMVKWLFPNHIGASVHLKQEMRTQLTGLGPMSKSERRVLMIFGCTSLLWITKDLINLLEFIQLDDTMIALTGAISLFICPSGNPTSGSKRLLEWEDTSKMAWGILLLFGGGLTLAAALDKAGLIASLGQWIASISGDNMLVLIFTIVVVSIFISELMSNIAQVIVFAPVIGGIADAMQINPILIGLPMTLAASCASMLPMGTPPNAIVFSSGHIPLKQMVRTGFVLNLVAVVVITLLCWWLVPLMI
jgi:sodium-dependent dicarboxylate transporter 2/3/5